MTTLYSMIARAAAPILALGAIASPLFAQNHTYRHDDGSSEGVLGQNSNFVAAGGALQGFKVPGGGTDQVESLSVVLTTYWHDSVAPSIEGLPLEIGVWSDPNGDRNPSDAVLLGSSAGHTVVNSLDGQWVTYAFPAPITVTDRFFVGVMLPATTTSSAICSWDDSAGYRFDSWYFSNAGGPLNLTDLQQNSGAPTNAFLFGRFMIRVNDGDHGTPIGWAGCPSNLHSELRRATLLANGYNDLSTGQYRVNLTAIDMPADRFTFFLASQTFVPAFMPLNSRGNLCLGGNILRIYASLTEVSLARQVSWDVDVGNVDSFGSATPGLDVISAGQNWSFQAWFRDDAGAGDSNLSSSVTVQFQ